MGLARAVHVQRFKVVSKNCTCRIPHRRQKMARIPVSPGMASTRCSLPQRHCLQRVLVRAPAGTWAA